VPTYSQIENRIGSQTDTASHRGEPTIVILKGPNAGQRYELGTETLIGRDTICDITISSGSVSRNHARIKQHDDGFWIEDLGSLNGTFVNGEQIYKPTRLKHKDRIHIYQDLLAFLDSSSVDTEATPDERSATLLAITPTKPRGPNIVSTLDATSDSRIGRNPDEKWRASLSMIRNIGLSLNVDEILRRVLDDLFKVFSQTDRGYILLLKDGSLSIEAMRIEGDTNEQHTLAPVDHSLAMSVIQKSEAVLCRDHDEGESDNVLEELPARTMMCAPLMRPLGEPLGVIYLDTKLEAQSFQEEDVELLTSVSNIAGQAVELARTHETSVHRHKEHQLALEQEIRERKQVEEELRRSNEELQQFAYVASHDLQEPLRAIAGFVQLLQEDYEDKLDETAAQYIRHTVEGAKRMQALINDLLRLSRVRTKGQSLEPVDCNKLVESAVENLKPSIDASSAKIDFSGLPTVTADGPQLTQLFQNLIGNAITFRGNDPPHVVIEATKDKGAWRFAVHDNGMGIKPEHHERVFVVFQRLHTRDKFPGNGIGLAICKRIVERHRGEIWVESQPGQGSVFYFTIPERNG